jgi:prepilin-type N-terminal cleavage/methylation domain-containing protein
MNKTKNITVSNKGFSLVEMLVALPLILVVFAVIWGTYITTQKLFPGGITQVALQSYGRSALGRIAGNIRLSTGAVVNVAGDTLTVTLDPNLTYNNPGDDVTAQYTLVGTDIIYDPDIFVNNNEVVLLQNAAVVTGVPVFQKNQDLIVITFKVIRTNIFLGTQSCSLSTSVKMRSSDE